MAKEIQKPKLNEVIIKETRRADGSLRIQQDFSNCPTLAEQHTAHMTNINYLIDKYKPDELAAYLAARNQYKKEILGHDFSQELPLDQAMNVVVSSRKEFEKLPENVRNNFRNHLEFLKFIDNPANEQKLIDLGVLKKAQIEKIKIPDPNSDPKPKEGTTP
nr:MAG: internal scaffolding protein [Microvirus sp.]